MMTEYFTYSNHVAGAQWTWLTSGHLSDSTDGRKALSWLES